MDVDEALRLAGFLQFDPIVQTLAAEVRRLRAELDRAYAHHDDDQRMLLKWTPELERLRAIERRAIEVRDEDPAYDGGPEALYILGEK